MSPSLTRLRNVAFCLMSGLVLLTASWGSAQTDSPKQASDKTGRPSSTKRVAGPARVSLTPERQAAALQFARRHHPALYQLMHRLKKAQRPQYQRAIRQLSHDSERLARIKERAPSRYRLALTEWQLDSRLRLLVARMTMSDDPELEAELQDLLEKRQETRLKLWKLDRERLAARLAKMDEQIREMEEDQEAALQKDLQRIQRSLGLTKRSPRGRQISTESPRSSKSTAPQKSN